RRTGLAAQVATWRRKTAGDGQISPGLELPGWMRSDGVGTEAPAAHHWEFCPKYQPWTLQAERPFLSFSPAEAQGRWPAQHLSSELLATFCRCLGLVASGIILNSSRCTERKCRQKSRKEA
ncbi:hypothetical protein H1C71_005604, partial [Ictidomys tridecemlineatus]